MDNPQPRRSSLRATVLALAVLLVVLLGASLLLKLVGQSRLRRTTAELQSRTGVTTLNAFEKPKLSDDQNAARWLQAGGAALNWSQETKRVIGDASNSDPRGWSAEQVAAVRAVLADSRAALDLLRRGSTLEQASFAIPYGKGAEADLPNLLQLISAGRLLMADARVAFADDDPARGIEALRTLGRLAVALEDEPLLITELIGIACERMLLTVAAEAVASPAPWASDPALLDELDALVPSTDLAAGLRRAFAFEALSFTQSRGELLAENGSTPAVERLFARTYWGLTCAEANHLVLGWCDMVDVPYTTAPERFKPGDLPPFFALHRRAAHGFTPNLGSAIVRIQVVRSLRQLVHAAIELRVAAAAAGAYPAEPAAVTALTSPSPLTGQPVTYRLEPDGRAVLDLPGVAQQVTDAGMVLGRLVLTVELPPPQG